MSTYNATILWKRNGQKFTDNRYNRTHIWQFDGGYKIQASSSTQVVPLPFSDPSLVDPEEAYLASLTSCHMLWFLSIVAKKGLVVDQYKDASEAVMDKNDQGKLAITKVILRPVVKYGFDIVVSEEENKLMHLIAHEKCFIANSVQTEINIDSKIEISCKNSGSGN